TQTQTSVLPASTTTVLVTSVRDGTTVTSTSLSIQPAQTQTIERTTTAVSTSLSIQPASTRDVTSTLVSTRDVTTTQPANNVFLGRPAPFTTCDNQGVQYEAVVNDQPGHVNNAYTAYNPAYLKATSQGGTNQRIYNIGTHTTFAGFVTTCPNNAASNVTFYNSPTPYSCQQFSLNHRGYFYIYATGVWTFTATLVDDAFIFWGGWFARKGWTKANSDISSWFTYGPGNGRGSVSLTLTAGTYLPVRVVFGQAVGGAGFNLNITDPSGAVALDTRTVSSPYLVRFSCDGQAPPYNYDFGQEI
ncbi:Ca2+-modulated nonselective cation channel polycystin, partial [Zymoseptoria tritici IPO323]